MDSPIFFIEQDFKKHIELLTEYIESLHKETGENSLKYPYPLSVELYEHLISSCFDKDEGTIATDSSDIENFLLKYMGPSFHITEKLHQLW